MSTCVLPGDLSVDCCLVSMDGLQDENSICFSPYAKDQPMLNNALDTVIIQRSKNTSTIPLILIFIIYGITLYQIIDEL